MRNHNPLINVIMEWGCFMYLRMPQGYLASSDAYTCRYDEIIKDVPRKVKVVNDSTLWRKHRDCILPHARLSVTM